MAIGKDNFNVISVSSKSHKIHYFTQIFFRILAIGATLSSACVLLTNKQTTIVYGIEVDARYNYSPAFKFFAGANFAASALTVFSLIFVVAMEKKAVKNSTRYFLLFLHDLLMTVLVMAGLAAALAISYVGKYGNSNTGWIAICDHFGKFCNTVAVSIALAFLGDVVYLLLAIISANRSRQVLS